jgi:cytochrome c oxidase subunit 1
MAYYDYTHPALHPQAWTVTASALGGLLLVASAALFVWTLARAQRGERANAAGAAAPFTFSLALHPHERPPPALNRFGLWVGMMIALTVVNYGFPIVQLARLDAASVPVIPIGSR